MLLKKRFVKITGLSSLQLNPCTRRAVHNVPNAIVLASTAFPPLYPIINAIIVVTPIERPPIPIRFRKLGVRIDSFIGLGFSFITSIECGSSPNAIAGRLSVSKLMNNRCTGANGTGRPAIEAYNTARIAPKLPERRNRIAFLIFRYTFRPFSTAFTIVAKLSSVSTIDAASLETSLPVIPIATPISACFNAGASLTPSPVMETIFPFSCHARTIRILCSGDTRAYTEIFSTKFFSSSSVIESISAPSHASDSS